MLGLPPLKYQLICISVNVSHILHQYYFGHQIESPFCDFEYRILLEILELFLVDGWGKFGFEADFGVVDHDVLLVLDALGELESENNLGERIGDFGGVEGLEEGGKVLVHQHLVNALVFVIHYYYLRRTAIIGGIVLKMERWRIFLI